MTDARSTYDETNEVWPYFVLTVIGVVLVPLTIAQLARLMPSARNTRARPGAHDEFNRRMNRRKLYSSWKLWVVVVGWVVVGALVAIIRSSQPAEAQATPAVWDPYEILGIPQSASAKEIKTAYRKLSLEFHPDKVKDNGEQAKEDIEAVYVEISKAYRALTDEVTRENFLQFGHPDGPQPVVQGIALPSFLLEPSFATLIMVAYLLGFGVLIPVYVGRKQTRTRKGILHDTAEMFAELLAKEQPHFITTSRILETVLMSPDMEASLRLIGLQTQLSSYADRLKTLRSYLDRKEPQSQAELLVATETSRLLLELHEFSAAFRSMVLCQRLLELRRCVVQAVPFHLTQAAEYLQLKGSTVQDLDLKAEHKEKLLSVTKAARSYVPRLHLLSANCRVVGETEVYTSSQVYIELKFLVLPLGDQPPKLAPEEINPPRDVESESFFNPVQANAKEPALPDAVAPFFPQDVQTSWYIYLLGEREMKLAEKPLEVLNLNLHNLQLSRQQVESGDDVVIGTLNVPMSSAAPPTPETLFLRVEVLSTTYFGVDMRASVTMDVKQPKETPKIEDDDEQDEKAANKADDDESDVEIEGLSDIDTSTEEEDNGSDGKEQDEPVAAKVAALKDVKLPEMGKTTKAVADEKITEVKKPVSSKS